LRKGRGRGGKMKKMFILLGLLTICFGQPFHEKDPRAIIEKVRIYRLTQELDLTTEQAMVFFPKLTELQNIEKDFAKEKMQILHKLKDLIRDEIDEEEILKTVSRYEAVQKKKFEEQIKKIKEMWQILTPVQRAKYLIFQEEFNREIREMIKEIKKHRPPKP
jgi:Spy/CpxP family protein refolding chaperone